jgi:hypothetical protein
MDQKKEVKINRKRYTSEQIIGIPRQVDVELSQDKNIE